MEAAALIRFRREERKRIQHGSCFSQWKVLVGPSDWADYSLGKEGAYRYRVHNLPSTSGPGLYELGVARKSDKLDSNNVVVVYVGQADNVRTRLQCYGRNGAHLNNSNDGSGCFDDIFSNGLFIVYRWAPMKNKADALKTESGLLKKIDYAWNERSNGTRRYNFFWKPDNVASNNIQFPKTVRNLQCSIQKPAGIEIEAIKLPLQQYMSSKYSDEEVRIPQIFNSTKSRPKLVLDRGGADKDNTGICGVPLDDGFVCSKPPVEGRKRCTQHKGLMIGRSNLVKPPVLEEKRTVKENKCNKPNRSNSNLTGKSEYVHDVVFDSNSDSSSNYGEMYRTGRVRPQVFSKMCTAKDTICGVEFGDGTFCTRQPSKGRVRCEEHKGLKIKGIKSSTAAEDKYKVYDGTSNLGTSDERNYCSSVCGALTRTGSYCRNPVKGNTRCWHHSGQVLKSKGLTFSAHNDWSSGGTSICGARTRTGSFCRNPVKGGGRCRLH